MEFGNKWTMRISSLIIVIIVWELLGNEMGPLFLATPSSIVQAAYGIIVSGEFAGSIMITFGDMASGFVLALVGIPVGLMMGVSRKVEYTIDPYINALYVLPLSGIIPLLIVWFGIGPTTRTIAVLLAAFFPIVINTLTGVRNTDPELLEMARSFKASQGQLFRKIYLLASLPYIIAGLRLGIGRAITTAILVEMMLISGVGMTLVESSYYFRTATVFAILVIIMLWGVVLTELVKLVGRRITWWKRE